jgi:PEP-CTERM motif
MKEVKMSKKLIPVFFTFAVLIFAASSAKASPIQIGLESVSATCLPIVGCLETIGIFNATSTTLNIQTETMNTTTPFLLSIAPNSTVPVFSCLGGCTLSFSGDLGSLAFSIAGQDFVASTLSFTTPTLDTALDRSVPITIDAVSATPEPASILLFSTGLLGIAFLLRKGLLT